MTKLRSSGWSFSKVSRGLRLDSSEPGHYGAVVDGAREPLISFAGLQALPEFLAAAAARRVFVIASGSDRNALRLAAALASVTVQMFPEARRHVPAALVERAERAFDAFQADTVLSIGGGSATGLGKALRLSRSFHFIAVPTTYAASELTNLYGVTSAAGKRTGRDTRVVPDAVLYDVELTLRMPLALSVTSLMNALAHPISALSTGKLDALGSERALAAARAVYAALEALLLSPGSPVERRAALEAMVLAGRVLATSPVGLHHRLAHLLGGQFDLDHAGLHSVLLPHTTLWMQQAAGMAYDTLCARLGVARAALPARFSGWLSRARAATSLSELGVDQSALVALLASHPELPAGLLEGAFAGQLSPEPAR
ncbi:MAG TPA: iron-containing alcohol dehydrogenase [Polyangiaceae bacterium]|nr:iron-containing alcohol dehydrogenase [Polyangiaceae bacterium]